MSDPGTTRLRQVDLLDRTLSRRQEAAARALLLPARSTGWAFASTRMGVPERSPPGVPGAVGGFAAPRRRDERVRTDVNAAGRDRALPFQQSGRPFSVILDGEVLTTTPVLTGQSAPVSIDVPVTDGQILDLDVGDGGNGNDHADWAAPVLTCGQGRSDRSRPARGDRQRGPAPPPRDPSRGAPPCRTCAKNGLPTVYWADAGLTGPAGALPWAVTGGAVLGQVAARGVPGSGRAASATLVAARTNAATAGRRERSGQTTDRVAGAWSSTGR